MAASVLLLPSYSFSAGSAHTVWSVFVIRSSNNFYQPAGPKITSRFPRLLVYIYIYLCVRTYHVITCAIITSRILLPCDLDLRRLLPVATMSSLVQLRVRDGYPEAEAT